MRRAVAITTVALALAAAGSARAGDATRVIYDLSAVRAPNAVPRAEQGSPQVAVPMHSLPISMPSARDHRREGELGYEHSGHNLELLDRSSRRTGRGQPWRAPGPRGQLQEQPPGTDNPLPPATANPEPGTMLLLGTGLAAGARFLRRKNAS
jgi:hypothetical protein